MTWNMPNKLKKAHWYAKSDSQIKPKQVHRYAKSGSQICQIRLTDMPSQAHKYAKSGSQICLIRLADMPNQAHKYAKSGSQICQIRLKIMPNQAKKTSQIRLTCRTNVPNRACKAKSGSNQATTTRHTRNKIQLSFPLQSRTKASDTPTTRRSKLRVKTRKLNAL